MNPIVTRFAPSPTGYLHVGGVRTALYSYAFAKHNQGEFLLRIEDTDKKRSTQASVDTILQGLDWLGIKADNKDNIVYQSDPQRMQRYKTLIQKLLDDGYAYYCYSTTDELDAMRDNNYGYNRKWRDSKDNPPLNVKPVVRFKMPLNGQTIWNDLVKGSMVFDNDKLEDFIIARSDGTPTYNFCVVVDDMDMKVSHVIRGDDHVNNTPKQIQVLKALNADIPQYAHLPMIFNHDGQKMSKRNNDTVAITDYIQLGILPEALLNYLARLGWGGGSNHANDEFFTMEQFIDWFDIKDVSESPSRFDFDKLMWLNHQHIQNATVDRLYPLVKTMLITKFNMNDNMLQIVDLKKILGCSKIKERAKNIHDLAKECSYFYQQSDRNNLQFDKSLIIKFVTFYNNVLNQSNWNLDNIESMFKQFCRNEQIKIKDIAMPVRKILCSDSQLSVYHILDILGYDETWKRLMDVVK